VVLDATNLNNKLLKTKLSLASRYGATVRYWDFNVSLAQALARNAGRERQLPASALEGFFKRYKIDKQVGILPQAPSPIPEFLRYEPDTSLPSAYIVDTDGTVANHEGIRSPFDTTRYHLDTPHGHVVEIVRALFDCEYPHVLALSGRDEKYRAETQQWWHDHVGYPEEFFFRPTGDTRMDAIVKYELFRDHIAPNYNVIGAFDDRPQVVRMWETIGVPVFMVGPREEF